MAKPLPRDDEGRPTVERKIGPRRALAIRTATDVENAETARLNAQSEFMRTLLHGTGGDPQGMARILSALGERGLAAALPGGAATATRVLERIGGGASLPTSQPLTTGLAPALRGGGTAASGAPSIGAFTDREIAELEALTTQTAGVAQAATASQQTQARASREESREAELAAPSIVRVDGSALGAGDVRRGVNALRDRGELPADMRFASKEDAAYSSLVEQLTPIAGSDEAARRLVASSYTVDVDAKRSLSTYHRSAASLADRTDPNLRASSGNGAGAASIDDARLAATSVVAADESLNKLLGHRAGDSGTTKPPTFSPDGRTKIPIDPTQYDALFAGSTDTQAIIADLARLYGAQFNERAELRFPETHDKAGALVGGGRFAGSDLVTRIRAIRAATGARDEAVRQHLAIDPTAASNKAYADSIKRLASRAGSSDASSAGAPPSSPGYKPPVATAAPPPSTATTSAAKLATAMSGDADRELLDALARINKLLDDDK